MVLGNIEGHLCQLLLPKATVRHVQYSTVLANPQMPGPDFFSIESSGVRSGKAGNSRNEHFLRKATSSD